MQVAPTRRLRLIVPGADGRTALADGSDLPGVDVALAEGESTWSAAGRWLSSAGLDPWPVDCIIDQIDEARLGGRTREALVVVAPAPVGWRPPNGWAWRVWGGLRAVVADGIGVVANDRIAEHAGERPVPTTRPAWSSIGWIEQVRAWVDVVLARSGRPSIESVAPVRLWGISAVVRIETGAGRCFFKAAAPIFGSEPAVTAELQRWSAGSTPSVIAVDIERAWMLVDDLGATEISSENDTRSAIDRLTSLQHRLIAHRVELELAGCRHRPIAGFADAVAAALESPVTTSVAAVDASTRARIVAGVEAAVAEVQRWNVPEACAHGDFHPGNVAATPTGLVIFDWSDACFTSPLVDAATWASWYVDDPEREEFVWSCFEASWQRQFGLDPAQLDRRVVVAVAAAFHLQSYVEICSSLEPSSRLDHVEGLTHFVGLLERTCV